MKLISKQIMAIILVLIIILFLWFTNKETEESKLTEINIGTFSEAIDYGPFYIARHFGWFEEALKEFGVEKVEYLDFNSFIEIQSGLNSGNLHAFFSAEAPIIKLVSDNQPIKIVEIGCTLQQDILVRLDSGINSISDLKGKSIAVAEGTSSHFGLMKILHSADLKPKDVIIRPGFPGVAKPQFESGEADAWAVWPPFVEEQLLGKRGKILSGGNARIQSVLSINTSLLKDNAEISKAIVKTVQRTKSWMLNNQDESITIIAQFLKYDKAIVELAWPKHNWSAIINTSVLEDIDEKAIFLKDVGVINDKADIPKREDLIDLKYAAIQ